MAAGDLITRDGQYEFNGLLMNDGAAGNIQVLKSTGLFELPEVKVTEYEMQDDDGGFTGPVLMGMRRVTLDLAVRSENQGVLHTKLQLIRDTFQPQAVELPLVFQKAAVGKRQLLVTPRRLGGFDSDWNMAMGLALGSVMLVAPDPRITSLLDSSLVVTIASGATTSAATNAVHSGTFRNGAWPVLSIAGPATNPRIANAGDGGRQIKLDLVVNAGETLVIDVKNRTALKGGVDVYDTVRDDNQWWRLMPGANLITYSRSNTPATASNLTVTWKNSFP